ncbi:MAG: SixA phosphatase family protein [Actinomycetota bacterium]
MRQVWLLRHAKSSWDDPSLPDEERPLAPRGYRDAATMASYLASVDPPRLVLCSAGLRARQTLAAVLPWLGSPLRVAIEPELYTFDSSVLIERLRRLDDAGSSVLIVGHNPALEDLALWLSAEGELRERLGAKFPTAALARIDLPDASWTALSEGVGTIARFVVPKDLSSGARSI